MEQRVDVDNRELQQAWQIIEFTRRSLFLTGKAGTGKSTFLRYVCEHTKKKYVVLAPTGIAAVNVGGSTLHSFFKLPFHPLLPNDSKYSARNIKETLKYNGDKRKIIREVELIIIDEISMVRADIVDFIDKVLRIYSRNLREPFGGKQLLLIGDVFQLEPVVKEEDWRLLKPFYKSCFFFDAHVFGNLNLVSIELRKVYRQNDPMFISILDHVRQGKTTDLDLKLLNRRTDAPLTMKETDRNMSVTLSTRRDNVDYINNKHLEELPGSLISLEGEIKGEFPESSLPTLLVLGMKVGAQIIFVKNDIDHRWVNGTIGVIVEIDEENNILYVLTDEGTHVEVGPERWSNVRYTYNEKEKKIEEEEIGVFIQFPVRLAWAITVHKSQGLTFRQLTIDLSGGVFAAGQTYVALSRCTSLEGISLKEPIKSRDVFVKQEVINFSKHYNDNHLIELALKESKADKEYHDAVEAFDNGDFDAFLKYFFLAIHSRYDIEQPVVKRFIRRKLHIINQLKAENERIRQTMAEREAFLRQLAAEYVILGKECEHDHMHEAAIANYRKALRLYPDAKEAERRIKRLSKK